MYIEKVLADEISFLFYMFFYVRDLTDRDQFEPNYSAYFPEMLRTVRRIRTLHMEDGVPMFKYKTEIEPEGVYPLESFVNIVRNDKDVRQLLVNWIDDASKYQSDVQAKISRLKSYTQKE